MDTLSSALSKKGIVVKEIERWKAEMPREEEMEARDKYTVFARNERKYRKGIHSEFFFVPWGVEGWGVGGMGGGWGGWGGG